MSSKRNMPTGYNTEIPAEIMTPGTVETSIGTLKFSRWRPTSGNRTKSLRLP